MDLSIPSLIALLVTLGISITLHEFMHAFMGNYLGDDTARENGRLTLNPLAHIDPFFTVLLPIMLFLSGSPVIFGAAKPVPFNPHKVRYADLGAALVALAGPMTNLVLAVFTALWLRYIPVIPFMAEFFAIFIVVNVGFFVFNMIPFPPLDGSRVLYALVPEPVRAIMRKIEQYGIWSVLIFLLLIYPSLRPVLSRIINWFLESLLPGVIL